MKPFTRSAVLPIEQALNIVVSQARSNAGSRCEVESRRSFGDRFLPDRFTLDEGAEYLQAQNFLRIDVARIAVEHNQIRVLANFERSDTVVLSDMISRIDGDGPKSRVDINTLIRSKHIIAAAPPCGRKV